MLHNAFLRVRVDERVESLQRKLAEAWQSKACYVVVIGDREVDEGMISVQRRGDPSRQKMAGGDLRELLQKEVSSRW